MLTLIREFSRRIENLVTGTAAFAHAATSHPAATSMNSLLHKVGILERRQAVGALIHVNAHPALQWSYQWLARARERLSWSGEIIGCREWVFVRRIEAGGTAIIEHLKALELFKVTI